MSLITTAEVMKEEPTTEAVFLKCEMCKETSDNETECVHGKNDRLGNLIQDYKVPSLYSADGLYMNSNTFKEDVEPKVENTDSSSSQKEEDSIMKLINAEVMVEEDEYCDSPEYLSTKDFVECETGDVKTEDYNIFCESVKNEPSDNGASLSSVMLAHGVHPGSSKDSLKDFGSPQVDAKKKSGSQCNVCSKSFNRNSSLKRHQRIHTGEKPYICKICSKCFNDSSALRKHLKMHRREKTYPCKFCPKTFNQADLLKQHRKMHVLYNCDICSKSFNHVSNFRKHSLIHTREKR